MPTLFCTVKKRYVCKIADRASPAEFLSLWSPRHRFLEDLLIAVRLPCFAKRAKRRVSTHPTFYYFDAGVYQAIRPRGPLDAPEEIQGPALETVLLQHLRAINDYQNLGYTIHYWRTVTGDEVDFVLYGERGLRAVEIKRSHALREHDLHGLFRFKQDYPEAKAYCLHLGNRRWHDRGIDLIPASEWLLKLGEIL